MVRRGNFLFLLTQPRVNAQQAMSQFPACLPWRNYSPVYSLASVHAPRSLQSLGHQETSFLEDKKLPIPLR